VIDRVKMFLARAVSPGGRSARLHVRCSPEERAAYDAAAAHTDMRDASSWARQVLSREARKVLRPR